MSVALLVLVWLELIKVWHHSIGDDDRSSNKKETKTGFYLFKQMEAEGLRRLSVGKVKGNKLYVQAQDNQGHNAFSALSATDFQKTKCWRSWGYQPMCQMLLIK